MSTRADRLLALIQALRRRRCAVSARALAEELGVSERTIYRDIDTLRASGLDIGGTAGVGFLLRKHAFLAPLAFSRMELDALALGLHFVQARAGEEMRAAAIDALAKIAAVVAPETAAALALPAFIAGPPPAAQTEKQAAIAERIRTAIARERALLIEYQDASGQCTRRTVWPILVGLMEGADLLAAWCELRQAMRHFRLDRIASAQVLTQAYGVPRATLFLQWQREQA